MSGIGRQSKHLYFIASTINISESYSKYEFSNLKEAI